jgi:hypothetical protein
MVTVRCAMLTLEDRWLVPLACRTLFTLMELKWLKLIREGNDDLNLRPCRATWGKGSMFGWEGRGVVYGYSELKGGSPCLCRLRTVCSGPLNEHLILY